MMDKLMEEGSRNSAGESVSSLRNVGESKPVDLLGSTGKRFSHMEGKTKRSVSWSHVSTSAIGEENKPFRQRIPKMNFKTNDPDEVLHNHIRANEQKRSSSADTEHFQRLSAFGISLSTTLSDVVLAYPCLVLRRQCQVNNVGKKYHFTPFTIVAVAFRLQKRQGFTCLWKGVGSHLMINALAFGVETTISETSRKLPKEIDQHSKLKDVVGHLLLKALSAALIMPFYSAHLVESIQSEPASETPGIFYFITEGFSRLFGFAGVQSRRMLPFRHLFVPTVLYFLMRYILNSVLQYGILFALRQFEKRKHQQVLETKVITFPRDDSAYFSVPSKSTINPESTTSNSAQLSNYKQPSSVQYHELLSSFIAQMVTDVILYPFETIIFRLHVQGTRTIIDDMDRGSGFLPLSSRYEGFFDCFTTVKNYEGRRALFRGFGALILQYTMKFSLLKFVQFVLMVSSPNV